MNAFVLFCVCSGETGSAKEKKASINGTSDGGSATPASATAASGGKNNRGSGRPGRGRHRSRGANGAGRSRSAQSARGDMEFMTDFVAPIFSAGLADYGSQDSAFVTPYVGQAIGGVGLGHVISNVALLIPASTTTNGYGNVAHQPHAKAGGDAVVVKELVRKQVYVLLDTFRMPSSRFRTPTN